MSTGEERQTEAMILHPLDKYYGIKLTVGTIAELMAHPKEGLKAGQYWEQTNNKMWCFTGKEAVDWMCTHKFSPSREDAVDLGQNMLERGFIVHFEDNAQRFMDVRQEYRFRSQLLYRLEHSIERKVYEKAKEKGKENARKPAGLRALQQRERQNIGILNTPVQQQRTLNSSGGSKRPPSTPLGHSRGSTSSSCSFGSLPNITIGLGPNNSPTPLLKSPSTTIKSSSRAKHSLNPSSRATLSTLVAEGTTNQASPSGSFASNEGSSGAKEEEASVQAAATNATTTSKSSFSSSNRSRGDRVPEVEKASYKLSLRTPVIAMTEALLQHGLLSRLVGIIIEYSRDIEGHWVHQFGEPGEGEGKLSYPHMIEVQARELFVVDHENNRVQVFRRGNGKYLRTIGRKGTGPGEMFYPTGIALNQDEMFVSEFLFPRIQVFRHSDGTFLRQWGEKGDEDGQFSRPGGICVARKQVYVADGGKHHCVQVFDLKGNFLRKIGNESELKDPCSVAVSGGKVFVADRHEDARYILVYDLEGKLIDRIGKLYQASNVLAFLDLLFVADCGANRIVVYDHTKGTMLRRWPDRLLQNEPTRMKAALTQPMGLASIGDELYVADSWNHQIQLFI